jgi:hypothetical protein
LVPLATLLATIGALCVVLFGVRLNPDVVALRRRVAMLLWAATFAVLGGGIGVSLVESNDPAQAEAAPTLASELGALPRSRSRARASRSRAPRIRCSPARCRPRRARSVGKR